LAQPVILPRRHALPPSVILPIGQLAGRFRYDTVIDGRARILPTWLVATPDRQLAARVATLFGGRSHTNERDGHEPTYTVLTDHAYLEVLLDGPQAIRIRMLRRHGLTVVRCCNGRTQRTPSGKRPCQCPSTLRGRWQAAKAGHGCEPLVHVAFRLAPDPTLGRFLLSSATWAFADHAGTVKTALRQRSGVVVARLAIDRALHTTSRGTTFAYTRPRITVLRNHRRHDQRA
jgi:hypothetical protein